jgi:hypothetical protein
MPSQTFHRTPDRRIVEITAGVEFRLENLEFFDPAAQKYYRDEFLQ